jgi:site-specific DNA recombinase
VDIAGLAAEASRAAIYCRIPLARRDDPAVDLQEQRCRQFAGYLGVDVESRHTFVDDLRLAWQRDRPRPGWDGMLAAATARAFDHLLLYRPQALLDQPQDFTDLLQVAEQHGIVLHAHPDSLDPRDDDAWAAWREQAARTSRSREQTSLAARASHERAAADGRAHGGGRRPYGYQSGMTGLVVAEAAIVAEIYARYLAGESMRAIAWDLNARGVPTALEGRWTPSRVARILDAPRYAGIRPFRGTVARDEFGHYRLGAWPACVSIAAWERTQIMRRERAAQDTEARRPNRRYVLSGLVECARCGFHMVGSMIRDYPTYACASNNQPLAESGCSRHIGAQPLEAFVEERAITILQDWNTPLPLRVPIAISRLTGEIREPNPTAQATRATTQRSVAIRPATALDGVVTGPGARFAWAGMSFERKVAVMRFLFAAIRISASGTSRNVFDENRIELIPGPL